MRCDFNGTKSFQNIPLLLYDHLMSAFTSNMTLWDHFYFLKIQSLHSLFSFIAIYQHVLYILTIVVSTLSPN